MRQYADNSPLNASIRVDYSKRRRRVWFSYPEKKKGKLHHTMHAIYPLFLVIYFSTMAAFLFFISLVGFIAAILPFLFNPPTFQPTGFVITQTQYYGYITLLLLLALIFLPPLLPALWVGYNYKRFKITIPKLQFWFYKLLEPMRRVRVKKIDSLVYELPRFKNVYLKYDLEGDFAAKLISIDVQPTQLHFFKLFRGKERKRQTRYWKAIFKFSSIPKDGQLVVDFL